MRVGVGVRVGEGVGEGVGVRVGEGLRIWVGLCLKLMRLRVGVGLRGLLLMMLDRMMKWIELYRPDMSIAIRYLNIL